MAYLNSLFIQQSLDFERGTAIIPRLSEEKILNHFNKDWWRNSQRKFSYIFLLLQFFFPIFLIYLFIITIRDDEAFGVEEKEKEEALIKRQFHRSKGTIELNRIIEAAVIVFCHLFLLNPNKRTKQTSGVLFLLQSPHLRASDYEETLLTYANQHQPEISTKCMEGYHSTSPNPEGISLGCACTVFAPESDGTTVFSASRGGRTGGSSAVEGTGTLLEVRRLWVCNTASDWGNEKKEEPNPRELFGGSSGIGQTSSSKDPNETCGERFGEVKKQLVNGDQKKVFSLRSLNGKFSFSRTAQQRFNSSRPRYDLYGFVRVKDTDHRFSGWYPLSRIGLKLRGNTISSPSSLSSQNTQLIRASDVIHNPILSNVYTEVTPGMARTKRREKLMEYLDERLLRDGKTPTTIRYMIYAQRYIFPTWYYAPFGLLNPSYDPMGVIEEEEEGTTVKQEVCGDSKSTRDVSETPELKVRSSKEGELGEEENQSQSGTAGDKERKRRAIRRNDFIRDAYLCPFSLRVFPTLDQLHYEIRQYRCGDHHGQKLGPQNSEKKTYPLTRSHLLHPPGTKIYHDTYQGIAVYEVDGSEDVTYCRHLCLLGKCFLEKKLAGHDVHNYYFYVLCLHWRYFPEFMRIETLSSHIPSQYEKDNNGDDVWFFAGCFSWEKDVTESNLACIVTLPCFAMHATRRQGGSDAAHQSGSTAGHSQAPWSSNRVGTDESLVLPPDSLPPPEDAPPVPRGLGQFMIRVSYELASRRGYVGGPERPLSDLGTAAYLRYWRTVLLEWWSQRLSTLDQSQLEGRKDTEGSDVKQNTIVSPTSRYQGKGGAADQQGALPLRIDGGLGAESPAGEEDDGAPHYTITEVAASAGLEVSDALRAVLHMGLLQWCGETRRPKWVLPRVFLQMEHDKLEKRFREVVRHGSGNGGAGSWRGPRFHASATDGWGSSSSVPPSPIPQVACFVPMWLLPQAKSYETPILKRISNPVVALSAEFRHKETTDENKGSKQA
eukprot:gene12192-8390_t